MSITETIAYKCTCERCSHSWTALSRPITCSSCRSPYWCFPKGNKITTEKMDGLYGAVVDGPDPTHPPVVVPVQSYADKEAALAELRLTMAAVVEKPKPKEILPVYPPRVEDQVDPYSELVISRD